MFHNKPDGHTTANGGTEREEKENRSFLPPLFQGMAFPASSEHIESR